MPNPHDELSDLFGRTRDMVEDLIRENSQLKACLRAFEVLGDRPSEKELQSKLRVSEEARVKSEQTLSRMVETRGVEEEMRRAVSDRLAELESQHELLTNLYVAANQLHSTLDYEQVLRSIQEIVTDLVGAESLHVWVIDEKTGRAEVALSSGARAEGKSVERGEGRIGRALETGEPYFAEQTNVASPAPTLDPLAVVPFEMGGAIVGLVTVHKLLKQKDSFTPRDYELFRLLGAQAATAITASKLHTASQRKIATLKGFIDMMKPKTGPVPRSEAEGR